jgi:hypothetical protein
MTTAVLLDIERPLKRSRPRQPRLGYVIAAIA